MTLKLPGRRLLSISTALFAVFWAIARASVQSITIDEADSFLVWVLRPARFHWEPASNNHVLNSLLMRLFTLSFGVSHLTVRAPALIGAILYIGAAYCLCRLLTRDLILQWPLFVCLVYNPFVFDYLVAARGYSLAVGFLMCLVAAAAWVQMERLRGRARSLAKTCAFCSICAALSFAANFSFAFVDAAAVLMVFLWACRGQARSERARILAACILPGLLATVLLCASVVLHWPKGQLWFGAKSLGETVRSVVESSLYRLNPELVNPLLFPVLDRAKQFLFPLLGAFCVWRLYLIYRNRSSPPEVHAGWLAALGAVLAGTVVLSLSMHRLSYRLFHLLLPMERTALYLVPLSMLMVGVVAAWPLPSRTGRLCRRGLIFMLFFLGSYFLLCLRLTYFKEWQWGEDVRSVYSALSGYSLPCGIHDIPSNWQYASSLNFYRVLSGRETIPEFTSAPAYPADRPLYVLNGAFEGGFIAEQRLKVIYRGESTDVVVAIRPGALTASPGNPGCAIALAR